MKEGGVAGACYPITLLPGLTPLFRAYVAGEAPEFYATAPTEHAWMHAGRSAVAPRPAIADILEAQNHVHGGGAAALANIAKLGGGARAVVTGQQVGLFGGPLYTLHKAASAVRLARDAERTTGVPHVPVFWLATEDHDFEEVNRVSLGELGTAPVTLSLPDHGERGTGAPVGAMRLGPGVETVLDDAVALLGEGAQTDLLRRCYRPEATFAGAFAQWLASVFQHEGLVVFDASGRAAHSLGSAVLRAAITDADALYTRLVERGRALEARGFHQQVLVKPESSLLFLLATSSENEPHTRLPLQRRADGSWSAGRTQYSTDELLAVLETEPERLSPNALLRPVFQDAIFPTAAYIGGPAEIAYFAQTAVLHQRILGRQTPVLPRLSATLLSPAMAETMDADGIDMPDLFAMPLEELVQRTGARHMPAEAKRHLQAANSAMAAELDALTAWLTAMDPELARPATVAGNKMRYQMNRLRRLAARRQVEQQAGIRRRVTILHNAVFPERHLQERGLGAAAGLAWFDAQLPAALVAAAGDPCPGHKLLVL